MRSLPQRFIQSVLAKHGGYPLYLWKGDYYEQTKNPAGRFAGFTRLFQAIEVSGSASTLYIGGQNAVDSAGMLVGKNDFALQCEQALINIRAILAEASYSPGDIVQFTIFFVQGNDAREGFNAFRKIFGNPEIAPVISGIQVAALAMPDYLVEISAIAVK